MIGKVFRPDRRVLGPSPEGQKSLPNIDPQSEAFAWISCVAYAIIAGVVSRMLLMPTEVLTETTLAERAIGSAVALLVFFRLTRRNLFAGVSAGALALGLIKF